MKAARRADEEGTGEDEDQETVAQAAEAAAETEAAATGDWEEGEPAMTAASNMSLQDSSRLA